MDSIRYESLVLEADNCDLYLTVTKCDSDATEVVIPPYINGMPVIAIAHSAFKGCDKLISVTVSDNKEVYTGTNDPYGFEIEDAAFAECSALKTVILPDCVSSIGHGAFRDCESLEEIYIPDCYVGPYAFYCCYSLKNVNSIDIISEGVFSHCKSLSVFPVKEGTEEIGEDAFEHCYALTEAVIPASVKRIEPLAFRNCHALKSVVFEEPENWYCSSRYTGADVPIDLYEPERNAEILRNMDFDDGDAGWFKAQEDYTPPKSTFEEIEEWIANQNNDESDTSLDEIIESIINPDGKKFK